MKVHVYDSYILAFFTILSSARAKSLYDSDSKFRDDSEVKLYPVKRKSPNYEQSYYVIAHEEQPDIEYADTLSNLEGSSAQRYHRIDDQPVSGLLANNLQTLRDYKVKPASLFERQLDLRRQLMQNGMSRRADRVNKRDSDSLLQSDDSYGMVYRKGRLVGILEPYPQAYELAPLSNVREGIEEIQPLPMNPPNTRQATDPRYSNNKLSSNKQSNWEWGKGESLQDSAKYTDEKYPMILTDFKIDSKMSSNSYKRDNLQNSMLTGKEPDKNVKLKPISNPILKPGSAAGSNEKSVSTFTNSPYHKDADLQFQNSADLADTKLSTDVKRSVPGITDERISELKSTLDRIQNPESSDKVEAIEEDLRGILNDMGLIENDASKNKRNIDNTENSDKRQVDKEDENLEQGANKIEIVKTSHDLQKNGREKRDDNKDTQTNKAKEAGENTSGLESNEPKLADESLEIKPESNAKAEPDSDKQNKEDAEVGDNQEKRGALKINVANYQSEGEAYIRNKRQESSTELNDIMRGLEKSGELTVSGNKSPLASSGNGPETTEKRTEHCPCTTVPASMLKAELNNVNYEKDIERNLQEKIDAIKDEVKREIAELQAKNAGSAKESQESQRKKRDAATSLLDEETSALNPQEHPEEKLVPYIRRRRNLESLEDLSRPKRGLPDFSNLKNIDTSDYLDLTGDKKREDHETLTDYQMDPQENKYLPQSLQGPDENSIDNSIEKRNTIPQQSQQSAGLPLHLNQNNINYRDDTAKINEESINSNQASLAEGNPEPLQADNESEAKEDSISKRQENNGDVAASKSVENVDLNSASNVADEENLQQSNPNEENSRNAGNAPDDIQKRQGMGDEVSAKNLIDTVVNQHFNAQLKKLTSDKVQNPSNNEQILVEKGNTAKEGLKEVPQEVDKKNAELPKSDKQSEMKNLQNQAPSGIEENKRIARDVSKDDRIADNQNLNLDTKFKRTLDLEQANPPELKKEVNLQETLRRRRQVEEEASQDKPQITYRRRKRANALLLDGNVAYVPYRADEEEVDDEGDEFDDDGFDDRTASMHKREASYNNQFRRSADYDNIQEYELPEGYSFNNYQPEQKNSLAKRYVARLNPDVYENPSPGYAGNYLYHPDAYVRRKRQDFDQLVALHGGGPMLHHLAAVRERNVQQLDDSKNKQKRSWKASNQNKEEPQNIADLSDTDLFGALPQSYEGELSRFKRVKRASKDIKKNV